MGRLNALMIFLIVICALLVVATQHKARGLFVALGRAAQVERQLENDWSQLQVEQVALSRGSRVEEIARTHMKLHMPVGVQTRYVTVQGLNQLQAAAEANP